MNQRNEFPNTTNRKPKAVVLLSVGAALGWHAEGSLAAAVGLLLLGTVAFAGIGLFFAGVLRAEIADLFAEEQDRLTVRIETLRTAEDEQAAEAQRSADVAEQFDRMLRLNTFGYRNRSRCRGIA